jgi:hypothetical protein
VKKVILCALAALLGISVYAQEKERNWGELHGNFQFDGQLYLRDSAIDPSGEFYPDERFLGQGYANLVYTRGKFRAGIRYENYQNVMLGFPEGYRGEGITYRFVQYVDKGFDITAGNFYEQFGSGMVLRAYEERGLGYDNVFDGIRVIYEPITGLKFKGILARQRIFFENSSGIIRGFDANLALNQLFKGMANKKTQVALGGSFVSKYQSANNPFLNIPLNVAASAVRLDLIHGKWTFNSEYVYKINDPSADNGYIFRPGQALLANFGYTSKGIGALLSFKRVDNMSFRSDRNEGLINGLVNFLPAISQVRTYALPSLYQYNTQLNGEIGVQAEVNFKIKRGSALGGKYGANLSVNFSTAYSIAKEYYDPTDTVNRVQYLYRVTDYFRFGDVKYWQDFNVKWYQKLNRKFSMTFTYFNTESNNDILGGFSGGGVEDEPLINNPELIDMVYVNTFVAEFLFKLKPKHYIRTELQAQFSKQDRGDMAMILVEYSISPNWFFTIQDIWNYGNPNPAEQIHYPLGSVVYVTGTTRIQLSYGRQQQGVFCVGGVCRVVPPSNGFGISVTKSF